MAKSFSSLIWDYLVFIIFVLVSFLIPLWSRIFGKKKTKSKADYVFAMGKISVFAMMLSIARGTLGVRSFIGYPSELFYRGSAMWETLYGMVNAYPLVLFIFIPVYFNLRITSVYQYLDIRFHSGLVRRLASLSFIIRHVLALGVTVYTPSVALNTIIGIPYWVSLCGMTVISIIFTILGGLKAAITADVIQGVTMILVSIVIIIQGAYETGGMDKVYTLNRDNGRLDFFNFSGDLTTRVDTLSAWLGQLFMSLSLLGCQQNFVQRYVSMKTFDEVKRTLLSNIPVIIVLFSLAWIVGMGIFSTYINCDPLTAGYIKKMDEILPFFVEDKFSYIPGFLGLFMGTIFNGALNLNVSNLNSLATVTWEDFLSPLPHFKGLKDKKQLHVIKFVGCIFAVLVMGVAFSVGLLSGIVESAMLMTSITSGPLLGAFILAMLCPMANWKGTSIGMISSNVIIVWLTFGSFTVEKPPTIFLPTSIDGCTNDTFSQGITKQSESWLLSNTPLEVGWDIHNTSYLSTGVSMQEKTILQQMYSTTYMYYSVFGTIITVIVGILISWMTASRDDAYDSKLLHPVTLRISRWFPGKERYYKKSDLALSRLSSMRKQNANVEHDNLGFETGPDCITTMKQNNICINDSLNKNGTIGKEKNDSQGVCLDIFIIDAKTDSSDEKKNNNVIDITEAKNLVLTEESYSPATTGIYKRIDEE